VDDINRQKLFGKFNQKRKIETIQLYCKMFAVLPRIAANKAAT
jgi:hypothetical protein